MGKITGQRDAMHSEFIRNGPDDAAGINVDDLEPGLRASQAPSAFVHRKVVPTTFAGAEVFS
jgi:hypothetical protein